MLEKLEALDKTLTLAVNNWGNLDGLWLTMSESRIWIPLYLLIAALLIWKLGWKRGLLMVVAVALGCVLSDQLCNLVKNSACRLRPVCDPEMLDRGLRALQAPNPKHCYGFYSAHSSSSFTLAVGSCLALRWGLMKNRQEGKRNTKHPKALVRTYSGFILLWAVLVAFSRIFVGKHFLGDIIVGALAGTILTFVMVTAMEWICNALIKTEPAA